MDCMQVMDTVEARAEILRLQGGREFMQYCIQESGLWVDRIQCE